MTYYALIFGFLIGATMGITGAGGAILAIPLLIFSLHLNITEAAPIALFAIMLSASAASIINLRAGIVRYKAAGLMGVLGICLAPIGVWLGHYLSVSLISILFAFVLAYVAWLSWRGTAVESINHSPAACQINPATSKLFWTAPCTAMLSLAGSVAGLLSGLLGVGGGFVIVPSLRKVTNFESQTIVATSLAAVMLVSTSGFLTYALRYAVNWHIALPFGASTLFGLLVATQFANKIPANYSRRGFSLLAFGASAMLFFKQLS